MHESESGTNFSPCLTNWLLHGEGLWPTKFEHPIQDVARDQRFSFLRFGMTSPEPVADDRFVSEEAVRDAGLLVVPRFLLPLTTPDLLYSSDRSIASAWSRRFRRRLSRENDDFCIACSEGLIDRRRVLSGVGREACNWNPHLVDEIERGVRIVSIPVCENLGNDHSRPIDTEIEFLSSALAAAFMLDCCPLALANDR